MCDVFEGISLFSDPSTDEWNSRTYLIDNDENIINSWLHQYPPASIAYLLPDSTIIYPCQTGSISIPVSAPGGRIIKYNWDGDILWDYTWMDDNVIQHHDIEPLPNGNILIISVDKKHYDEVVSVGRENFDVAGAMWPDMIVELEPIGSDSANIVWEWHFWDHLIQDVDPDKPNYGVISEHPERIDINIGDIPGYNPILDLYNGDWTHLNAVHYNADLDQIVVSSRRLGEIYIIDHSTTTQEASGSTGGLYGKGGDFLYRWGNPQNYGRGTIDDKILFAPHGVNWIDPSYPGGGNLILFNNGDLIDEYAPNYSEVFEFSPPLNEDGNYFIEDEYPFGPFDVVWSYNGEPDEPFFSPVQGGAFRLPNGNTLITSPLNFGKNLFEIDSLGNMVWFLQNALGRTARVLKYELDYLAQTVILGDINGDFVINVQDIILMVNNIINEEPYIEMGDMNNDGIINVLDILSVVNIIIAE